MKDLSRKDQKKIGLICTDCGRQFTDAHDRPVHCHVCWTRLSVMEKMQTRGAKIELDPSHPSHISAQTTSRE